MDPISNVVESKPKSNTALVVFLFVLVLLLSVALGYFVVKEYNLLPQLTQKTENSEEIKEEDIVVVSTDTYTQKNPDWGLYKLDKYEISVEVPDYTYEWAFQDERTTKSIWSVSLRDYSETKGVVNSWTQYLPGYERSLYVTYDPEEPTFFQCGQGCANQNFFSVDIFKNEDGLDLDTASDQYFTEWESKGVNVESTTKKVEKWDRSVVEFNVIFEQGDLNGYVVVSPNFVYVLEYYLAEDSNQQGGNGEDSKDVALNVLDSFTFGK